MAKASWGSKRICQNCGVRYYDFGKEPVICPSCNTTFDPEAFMRGRRARSSTTLPPAEIQPGSSPLDNVQDLDDAPALTPVEGVNEPDPLDTDPLDTDQSDVPEDLDLGPEFEDENDTSAADDDSLLDDDELGDDDLPPVGGISSTDDSDDG